MPLAMLLALTVLADAPTAASAPQAPPAAEAAPADAVPDDYTDIPPNAPRDDYGLVAWCYGALDEYLSLYEVVKPDLKAIDKMFGSPVKEAEPYAEDIADERLALKRFAAAMEAAEKASPQRISDEGVAAIATGRSIWSAAKLQPRRKLADAWLLWGVPKRCETTAASLKARATLLGQAMAVDAPSVDAPPAAAPPKPADLQPPPTTPEPRNRPSPAPANPPNPPAASELRSFQQ